MHFRISLSVASSAACRLQCDASAARMGPTGGCTRPKLSDNLCSAPEAASCQRGLATYTPAGDAHSVSDHISHPQTLLSQCCEDVYHSLAAGMVCVSYCVPQVESPQPSSAGDMWGLGVVLLGLVCGDRPVLSTTCETRTGAASLDALQEHITRQLTDQVHKAC